MRIKAPIYLGTFLLAALIAGNPAQAGDATVLGTTLGAITGGVLGSQIGQGTGQVVSTTLGVAIGGTIGNRIGYEIEREDDRPYGSGGFYAPANYESPIPYYAYAPNYVAPPAPPPTYIDQNARTYCRPYSQEIHIDGMPQESYGTACLQEDGTWRIVQ
ncbi:MAG: glycine zipper 2TM domain-containing protein [Bdellovibrionales bacterium]